MRNMQGTEHISYHEKVGYIETERDNEYIYYNKKL